MSAPRLEIDLDRIEYNARVLVERLSERGISVTGVTKAGVGSSGIANAMLRAGVSALGDSRIENIEALCHQHIVASMQLIRAPMLSQVERVVRLADMSFNTELSVINGLSRAARKAKCMHDIVLMVELGDLREGIMSADLENTVHSVLLLPYIALRGIGANLACHGGVVPDASNMSELFALADSIEATFDVRLDLVSGGNSANLDWAFSGADTGRINNLRLGESILLGCEPLHRRPIEGLHTDAITLVAEVIEAKIKPSRPWGTIAQTAFGEKPAATDDGDIARAILAIGRQDIDPAGLVPPSGTSVLGASGDHLIIACGDSLPAVGAEIRFGLNYSALIRAMTSPFVVKVMKASTKSEKERAFEYRAAGPAA